MKLFFLFISYYLIQYCCGYFYTPSLDYKILFSISMALQKDKKSSGLPAKTGLEGAPDPGADRALWVEQSNALLPDASPNNSFTNLINKYKKQYKVNSFEAKIYIN